MKKVPEIRFAEYVDDWEQRKLSDLIIEYKETVDSECDLPVLTSSKTDGVVLQEEHFGRKQQHDITGYNILPRGYCTYRNRSDGVDFTFNINKCCDKGIISKFYPVFYGNNSDVFFISLVLNHSEEVVHEIGYTCTGTGQKVLSFLDLLKMHITIPSYDEQKKIASYFEQLDSLITLHQRKLEKLMQFKSSMLEKMFPKNGESVPEIRFAGFTGAWEQRELGELAVEVKRKAEKDSDAPVMMISAAEGFIDQSQRYSNNNAGSSLKNYTLLYEGELAYNHGYSKFRNFGSVFDLRVEKARIPFVYHSFALPEDDHRFYAYYLNSGLFDGELKKLVSSTARMDGLLNISYEDYMSIPVLRPPVKEQKKIGRFLTSLDDLITLHQRKLEKLKQFKSGLLDKMFI